MCSCQVLHRGHGGGTADFQTMTLPLPRETIRRKRPRLGHRSFLQIESRLDDDISISSRVCMTFLSHPVADPNTVGTNWYHTQSNVLMGPLPAHPCTAVTVGTGTIADMEVSGLTCINSLRCCRYARRSRNETGC